MNSLGDFATYDSVDAAIRGIFGEGVSVTAGGHVGGGDINAAERLVLSNGSSVFLKSNRAKEPVFFEAEAEGLAAIAETGAISVPRVLGMGKDSERGAFLLLSFVEAVPRRADYWATLGSDLAAMHRADVGGFVPGGRYGFYKDNYIGSREQVNTPYEKWVDFFRDCRLVPRFKGAEDYFDGGMMHSIDRLLQNLDRWLVEPERPSLLHGDLWGGNVIVGSDGKAWLIDPAVYVGHAEADLAMTELFGGFSIEFYRAYEESGFVGDGYRDRRDIYNLYHLLNHLISFGRGYYGQVAAIVRHYAG